MQQLVSAAAVEDGSGQDITRRADLLALHSVDRLRKPMRREDRESLLPGRDDYREQPFLAGGERRLVAVVPVGDEELRVPELLRQCLAELGVEPPEAVSATLEIRLAEPVDIDRAVPEKEKRLELRAR